MIPFLQIGQQASSQHKRGDVDNNFNRLRRVAGLHYVGTPKCRAYWLEKYLQFRYSYGLEWISVKSQKGSNNFLFFWQIPKIALGPNVVWSCNQMDCTFNNWKWRFYAGAFSWNSLQSVEKIMWICWRCGFFNFILLLLQFATRWSVEVF